LGRTLKTLVLLRIRSDRTRSLLQLAAVEVVVAAEADVNPVCVGGGDVATVDIMPLPAC
jgi:hypothetical protein